jgi:hypothetical protein
MPANLLSEAVLDKALALALFERGEFGAWFLSRTKFRGEQAWCVFCRSDNPWSTVRLERSNPVSGELDILAKQCETDVLAVFETEDGRRLALHIENKLASGSFTPLQPELYRERMIQWKGRPLLGRYSDATTVLVAPKAFYEKFRDAASTFEAYVSHEDIAEHIPLFGAMRDPGA